MTLVNTVKNMFSTTKPPHVLAQLQDSEQAAKLYDVVLADMDRKLGKLAGRNDTSGRFARFHLERWREQLSDRLNSYRKSAAAFEAAHVELEAARGEHDRTRAKLEQELREKLEPFERRVQAATQAYDSSLQGATLRYEPPQTVTAHSDPGDTERIAKLAPKLKNYEPGYVNDCEDAAIAQGLISVSEMVSAIALEADYPGPLERKAFELRFKRFAYHHRVEVDAVTAALKAERQAANTKPETGPQ